MAWFLVALRQVFRAKENLEGSTKSTAKSQIAATIISRCR
jgi:hypothetical protein